MDFLFCFYFLFLITIFYPLLKNKTTFIIFSLLLQLGLIVIFFFFLSFDKKNSNAVFYESLPNDNSKIRNSIQSFIEKSSELNPFILPYDKNFTYIYFSYNFQQILLKSSISKHYSQLEIDIDKILKKFPFIPLAIVKDDNLVSLMDSPFIHLKRNEIENNITTTESPYQ